MPALAECLLRMCVCVCFVHGIVDSVLFPLTFVSIFKLFTVVVWYNNNNNNKKQNKTIYKKHREDILSKKVPQIRQGHKVSSH